MFGIRTGFSSNQLNILNDYYALSRYPSLEVKKEISDKISISVQQIDKWFINRRYKDKNKPQ